MTKFWNFDKDKNGERVLRLEGVIDSDNLWGDGITPRAFREELESGEGNVTVWINSPGGNVFAASEIYTMLMEYKGKITVKIDAIAASAASVVAMAGEKIMMSPTAVMMIHDPMTIAMGNEQDMEKVIGVLKEIKESIINAYQLKTELSRNKISKLMSEETWLNARKAVELGFADEILFAEGERHDPEAENKFKSCWGMYSARAMEKAIIDRLIPTAGSTAHANKESAEQTTKAGLVLGIDGKTPDGAMPFALLQKQLEFLKG